jgi:hypothetical protein
MRYMEKKFIFILPNFFYVINVDMISGIKEKFILMIKANFFKVIYVPTILNRMD